MEIGNKFSHQSMHSGQKAEWGGGVFSPPCWGRIVWCGVVWCGVLCCVVLCCVVLCCVVLCCVVLCCVVLCCVVLCCVVLCCVVLCCVVLCCVVLCCVVLCCVVLCCVVLCCIVLCCVVLCCVVLCCVVLCCVVLCCVVLCCVVLCCVVLCCVVLCCVVLCCVVLCCVVLCCVVLCCGTGRCHSFDIMGKRVHTSVPQGNNKSKRKQTAENERLTKRDAQLNAPRSLQAFLLSYPKTPLKTSSSPAAKEPMQPPNPKNTTHEGSTRPTPTNRNASDIKHSARPLDKITPVVSS